MSRLMLSPHHASLAKSPSVPVATSQEKIPLHNEEYARFCAEKIYQSVHTALTNIEGQIPLITWQKNRKQMKDRMRNEAQSHLDAVPFQKKKELKAYCQHATEKWIFYARTGKNMYATLQNMFGCYMDTITTALSNSPQEALDIFHNLAAGNTHNSFLEAVSPAVIESYRILLAYQQACKNASSKEKLELQVGSITHTISFVESATPLDLSIALEISITQRIARLKEKLTHTLPKVITSDDASSSYARRISAKKPTRSSSHALP